MREEHLPAYRDVRALGTESDDGMGIQLGQSVGGSVSHMDRMSAWRFFSPPSGFTQGVVVGMDGDRIAPEDLYGATFTERLIHSFQGKGYLILDSRQVHLAWKQVRDQSEFPIWIPPWWNLVWGHQKTNDLDTLASKIGVDTSMRNTIERYNADLQSDARADSFHKSAENSSPIEQSPFYAIDISIRQSAMHFVPGITLGGLRVHGESGLVLDDAGKSINRIYAAGRNAAGLCSNPYISGLSLADGVFSSRRAGEHAANAARD